MTAEMKNLKKALEEAHKTDVFILGHYKKDDDGRIIKMIWEYVPFDLYDEIRESRYVKDPTSELSVPDFLEMLENVTGDFYYEVFVITPAGDIMEEFIPDYVMEDIRRESLASIIV